MIRIKKKPVRKTKGSVITMIVAAIIPVVPKIANSFRFRVPHNAFCNFCTPFKLALIDSFIPITNTYELDYN